MHTGDLVSGKYRLVEQLGEGGMGEVWSAVNQLTNRRFAIKLLLPALAHHREALDRFLLEARATGELDDPCIVRVYDAGVADDGRPYLVMELLAGESLESRLAREERLAPLTACIHFSRIARALDRAHAAGIVHRDLSSANVFFASSGDGSVLLPKVLDFGVSKIQDGHAGGRVRTGRGAVLGSPAYMSPEQARGADQVDARSDVWSLGVLLYESLTGRPPFAARNYNALMVAILSAPHAPLASVLAGVDADLATLVDECLIKDPGARVASALDVASRLERIAERLRRDPRAPLEHPRRRASDRAAPSARRGGRAVTAVGAALGGTAFGLALGVALMSRPTEPAPTLGVVAPPPAATAFGAAAGDGTPSLANDRSAPASDAVGPAETDLVRATARSLGLPPGGAGRAARPSRSSARPVAPAKGRALALGPPRTNPY